MARGKQARELEKKKARRQTFGIALGALLLVGAVLIGISFFAADTADAAPVWLATTTEGASVGSDAFEGDVYVMDFFFLTCGICEQQRPANKAMIDALADRDDFHFVSITADPADTVSLIREHQVEKNATWPHVRDTYGLYQKFQVRGNPNLVFVDRDGNVALTVTDLASAPYLLKQARLLLDGAPPSAPAKGETQTPEHPDPAHGTPQGESRTAWSTPVSAATSRFDALAGRRVASKNG